MTSRRRKKVDEETTEIVIKAAAEASRLAVEEVRKHGLPLTVLVDGSIQTTYADGRVEIEPAAKKSGLNYPKGTILTFR